MKGWKGITKDLLFLLKLVMNVKILLFFSFSLTFLEVVLL